jgi:serine/threonine protein kinase
MLTTQTPWAGIDPIAVHLRIAFDECPPLSQLNGKISKQFEAAIELMLKREPEERPNAAELLKIPPFLDKNDSEKEEYRF